jgi:hypothetical protein
MMGNRMPQKSRNHEFSRAALCAVFGIALVIAGTAVVRAGDGGEEEGPYKKFFNKMLSDVGLRDPDASIEYKERPPLVVPPSRDLPSPASAGSLSLRNPDWPSDPDAKKRTSDRGRKRERSMLAGDRAAGGGTAGPTSQPDETQSGMWNKLTGWTKSITGNNKETATFLHEPARDALTDPPIGYRTPSSTQPYGIDGAADRAKATPKDDRQAGTVSR